ncbi:hypothetical protein [Halarchaeum sp. P4]|uniref:hypothetical protein n=1 Tax=Halarchaeum sp. P4 TaxID=3421639 RepID=UPI003EBF88BD
MRSVDTKAVYKSFFGAARFFYENGPRFIAVSALWFVCSLPVITIGPATLGAYAAIASLREQYSFDRGHVVTTLKRHGVSSVLLAALPVVFLTLSVLYTRQYFVSSSAFTLALGVVTAYAAAYTWLLSIPTFVGLATGNDLESSVRQAVRWTGQNALSATMMGLGTVLIAVVAGLMTIGFVLVFGGIAFAFHLETLLGPPQRETAADDSWSPYTASRRE